MKKIISLLLSLFFLVGFTLIYAMENSVKTYDIVITKVKEKKNVYRVIFTDQKTKELTELLILKNKLASFIDDLINHQPNE